MAKKAVKKSKSTSRYKGTNRGKEVMLFDLGPKTFFLFKGSNRFYQVISNNGKICRYKFFDKTYTSDKNVKVNLAIIEVYGGDLPI